MPAFKSSLFILLLVAIASAKEAEIELGLGIGSMSYPDYVGSKSTKILTLPFPHLRYRSDAFNIDEDGINGEVLGVHGLRLDLSVSGSLPSSSKHDGARAGMPDLDTTGEVGVNIIYNLFKRGVSELNFEMPLRAVLSTDFLSVSYQGVVSNPHLKYSLNYRNVEWTLRVGAMFADEDYNGYFYDVSDKYVTAIRNSYSATSGFSGFKNRISVIYQKDSIWIGAFISHFDVSNAVFKDSPLVETDTALYAGASIAYVFYTAN